MIMQNRALHRFNNNNVPVTFKKSFTLKSGKLTVRCTIENMFANMTLDHEEYVTPGMDIMIKVREKQLEFMNQLLYKYGQYEDVME